MGEYTESTKSEKLLELYKRVYFSDITSADALDIEKYNRSENTNYKAFLRLYRPKTWLTSVESYIIPVKDGAITGYLFRKKFGSSPLSNSLIIYLHDGGWMLGNMGSCRAFCSNICNKLGCAVLAIDYRLAPDFKFPTAIEDCYGAYMWAYQGTRYWKIDPAQIYIMGICTGGNLAIALSRLIRDRKSPKPAGLILDDPLTDCRLRTHSLEKRKYNPVVTTKQLMFYVKNYQREPKDILDPLFSPMIAVDNSRLPQTLIFSSEYSPLSDDAKMYNEVLNAADTPSKLIKIEDRFHGFVKFPKSERWEDEMLAIGSLLNGKAAQNIELLTRAERERLKRTKPRLIPFLNLR